MRKSLPEPAHTAEEVVSSPTWEVCNRELSTEKGLPSQGRSWLAGWPSPASSVFVSWLTSHTSALCPSLTSVSLFAWKKVGQIVFITIPLQRSNICMWKTISTGLEVGRKPPSPSSEEVEGRYSL